jgi:hypothetical protein
MTHYTHRIRRCHGNKDAWILVCLNDDGEEMEPFGSYTTALTIDDLLRHSGGLLPADDDLVQIIYLSDNT